MWYLVMCMCRMIHVHVCLETMCVKWDRCRLTAGTTNLTGIAAHIAAHQRKRVGQRRNCGDDMSGGRGRGRDRLDRDNAAASSGKGINARCKVAFVQKNYSQTHSHKKRKRKQK